MKRSIAAAIIVSLVSGCATYRPVVDTKGVDMTAYNSDLAECQQIATQVNPGNQAAGAAVAGALFGALLGVAIGGRGMAGAGAAIGGVQGAGTGLAHGAGSQVAIVQKCMAGRGYKVLG